MIHSTIGEKLIDAAEDRLCRLGLLTPQSWQGLLKEPVRMLYAGRLRRGLPQYDTHHGLTPYFVSGRNISHDVTKPYPLPDNSIDRYQSEDVFEHVELAKLPAMLAEIHRILKPGALFRLSLPDYNFDLYRARSQKDAAGNFLFDPGGGGEYRDGKVIGGGHLWFPTIDLVRSRIEASPFAATARYLQYNLPDGSHVGERIDYSLGYVQRTMDNDPRVADRPRPVSIVVDMIKS